MDNTAFSNICQILNDFYQDYRYEDTFAEYFDYYDIGIPLATCVVLECATTTEKGVQFIEQAWKGLCEAFGVDYHANFANLKEFLEFVNEG